MKRTYLFGTMVAVTLAWSPVLGQQTSGQSSSDSQKTVVVTGCLSNASAAATTGTTGTTGTAGTSGSTGSSTSGYGTTAGSGFVLTNAILSSGSSSSSSGSMTGGTAGTTGSTAAGSTGSTAGSTAGGSAYGTSASGAGKSFSLVGGEQSELTKYLNSQVEVRGTLDPASSAAAAGDVSGSSSSGAGTGTAATGTSAAGSTAAGSVPGASNPAQQLHVTSVRQLSSTCSGGN